MNHAFVENGNSQPSNSVGGMFVYHCVVLDPNGDIRPITRLNHGADVYHRYTIQKAFPGDLVLSVETTNDVETFTMSRFLNQSQQGAMRRQILISIDITNLDSPPEGACPEFDRLPEEVKRFLTHTTKLTLPDGFGWEDGVSREGYDKALFASKLFEFMPLDWMEKFIHEISQSPRFSVNWDQRIEEFVPNQLEYAGRVPELSYSNPNATVEWVLFTDNWDFIHATAKNPKPVTDIVCAFKIYRNAFIFEGKPYGAYIVFHTADGRTFKPRVGRDQK